MPSTARKIAAPATATVAPTKPIIVKNAKPKSSPATKPALSVVTSSKYEQTQLTVKRHAIEKSRSATLLCDLNWNITYTNIKFGESLEEFGALISRSVGNWNWTSAESLEGESIQVFFVDDPREFKRATETRYHPYQRLLKVGPCILDAYVDSIMDEKGTITGYLVEMNDVTARIKVEEKYKTEVKTIAERMEFLRGACSTDLADAMVALANGDFSMTIQPKTPLLEIPAEPDLALMAETFNSLRNQTVMAVEAYNKAKEALGSLIVRAQNEVSQSTDKSGLLASALEALANGDLTHTIEDRPSATAQSEIPDLVLMADTLSSLEAQTNKSVSSYNQAIQSLCTLIAQTQISASNITDASSEVMTGNDDLAQRTEQQAASLEETASSMEEMTSTVKQNADNSKQANQLAKQARESAEKGGQVVTKAVSTMEEINMASKRIADIISVIDEIAFQTNLLALNAAVEAARVGEQGRGFAVVAAEVRNLAGRSATAAKEIKALVQDSVQKVQEGSSLVNQSGSQLDEIVNSVKKVADIIAEITAAAQEQSAGIEQVNKAIIQMDQITQQNAALVEQASAASQSMNRQAAGLQSVVEQFTLDQSHVNRIQNEIQASQSAEDHAARRASHNSNLKVAPKPARVARASSGVFGGGADLDDFEEF